MAFRVPISGNVKGKLKGGQCSRIFSSSLSYINVFFYKIIVYKDERPFGTSQLAKKIDGKVRVPFQLNPNDQSKDTFVVSKRWGCSHASI